jgi:hypothetical protein
MLRAVLRYVERGMEVVGQSIPVYRIKELPVRTALLRMRFEIANDAPQAFDGLHAAIEAQMDGLSRE